MKSIRDLGRYPRVHDSHLQSPLRQPGVVWSTLDAGELSASADWRELRYADPGDILELLSREVGPPTGVCVLEDTVVGAAGWERIPLSRQYSAVTTGAAAFVAGAMNYLRVKGPAAGAVLDMLTPRDMAGLGVGRAAFALFTTPAGTVDNEAVVLRVAEDEYLLSCGGPNKSLSWLPEALAEHPDAVVEDAGIACFNIKGPRRDAAMAELLDPADQGAVAALKPFQACPARTATGIPVWVLRTTIGVEMWGDADAMRESWLRILALPELVTPCGWSLLDVYRLECDSMVFGVYPLELHGGTTLWEIGFEWMARTTKRADFIGRDGLRQTKHHRKLWLGGLAAGPGQVDVPSIGEEIFSPSGAFCGYVTTSGYSPKHGRNLAFAHLKPECTPGQTVVIGDTAWAVTDLPFTHANLGGRELSVVGSAS